MSSSTFVAPEDKQGSTSSKEKISSNTSIDLAKELKAIDDFVQPMFPNATGFIQTALLKSLKVMAPSALEFQQGARNLGVKMGLMTVKPQTKFPPEVYVANSDFFDAMRLGTGLFQSDGTGLSTMIKDAKKTADERNLSCAAWNISPTKKAVLIQDPRDVRYFVEGNKDKLTLVDSTGLFKRIFGDEGNIFIVPPSEKLMKMRHEFLGVLGHVAIKPDTNIIQGILDTHIQKIESSPERMTHLEEFANSIAMESISFCKLGMAEIPEETQKKITGVIRSASHALSVPYDQVYEKLIPFYSWLCGSELFQKYIAKNKLPWILELGERILSEEMIKPNEAHIVSGKNWLHPKEAAATEDMKDEEKRQLHHKVIINRLKLFLVVGHETSSNPIKLGLMLLSNPKYAEFLKKLRKDLEANPPETWSEKNQPSSAYLTAIIYEILRLYPPLPNLFYDAKEEIAFSKEGVEIREGVRIHCSPFLEGSTFAPGDMMVISPECTHVYQTPEEKVDPLHWKHNPKEFNPERFLEKNDKGEWCLKRISPHEWSPFGFAPRECLGKFFALSEAKIALGRLFSKYDFTCTIKNANGEWKSLEEKDLSYHQIVTIHLTNGDNIQMQAKVRNSLEEKADLTSEPTSPRPR